MKIPAALKIGNHVYQIETKEIVDGNRGWRGATFVDSTLIEIKKDLPESRQAQTLLHEILHACWEDSGLGRVFDDDDKERIVTALAPVYLLSFERTSLIFHPNHEALE